MDFNRRAFLVSGIGAGITTAACTSQLEPGKDEIKPCTSRFRHQAGNRFLLLLAFCRCQIPYGKGD